MHLLIDGAFAAAMVTHISRLTQTTLHNIRIKVRLFVPTKFYPFINDYKRDTVERKKILFFKLKAIKERTNYLSALKSTEVQNKHREDSRGS